MEKDDAKDKEDKKAAEDLFSAHDFDITIELGKYLLTLEIPVMCSLLKVNLNLSHFIIVTSTVKCLGCESFQCLVA